MWSGVFLDIHEKPLQVLTLQGFASSGQSRGRTGDLRIFSPSLYQLSYLSEVLFLGGLVIPNIDILGHSGVSANGKAIQSVFVDESVIGPLAWSNLERSDGIPTGRLRQRPGEDGFDLRLGGSSKYSIW